MQTTIFYSCGLGLTLCEPFLSDSLNFIHHSWFIICSVVKAHTVTSKERERTHLWSKHKGLHELPHGLTIVGQFSQDLHHHPVAQCGMSIHVPDLCVALAKLQGHDLLVDFLREQRQIIND